MTHWLYRCIICALFTRAIGSTATAEPIDLSHIPGDARWMVHIDMDAARKTVAWKELYDRLGTDQDFQAFLLELEGIFNARFPEDLHDLTICGNKASDPDAMTLVHATIDRKQVEKKLSEQTGYTSTPRGKYAVLTWANAGKTKFGGFVNDSLFMVGPSKERVNAMFDVMAGKTAPLKADGAQPKNIKAAMSIFFAGEAWGKDRPANQEMWLSKMRSGWLTIAEEKDETLLRLNVNAIDVSSAMQLKDAAEGLRSLIKTAAVAKDAKPITRLLSDVTAKAEIGQLQNQTAVQIRIPNNVVPDLVDEAC